MDEFWDTQSLFNLREASYLYASIYPPEDDDSRKSPPPKVANARRLLEYEKLAGRLEPVHRDLRGPEEFRREDLQRLPERQDHHPATLFPEEQQPATLSKREREGWAALVKALCLGAGVDLEHPTKARGIIQKMAAGRVGLTSDRDLEEKLKLARKA